MNEDTNIDIDLDYTDEVYTWAAADAWIRVHGERGGDPLACLVADALRQRGVITPQDYCAIWDNPDYMYDHTLLGDLPLHEDEIAYIRRLGGNR